MASNIVVAVVGQRNRELTIDAENRIVCDCLEQSFIKAHPDSTRRNCRHILALRHRLVTRPSNAIAIARL